MALKVIEGFDTYTDPSQLLARAGFLQWTRIDPICELVQGRFSGVDNQALWLRTQFGSTMLTASFAKNMGTLYMGFAMQIGADHLQEFFLHLIDTSNTDPLLEQLRLAFNGNDGSITTPFGRTANNLFSAVSNWTFVEVAVVCSKTAGRLTIRINGVTVVDLANVNTSPGPNAYINGFYVSAEGNNGLNVYMDDIYVCDELVGPGAFPCNNFLGDRRVLRRKVNGPGARTEWTPLTGTNWNEASVADGDTSYNATNTAGAEDLFTIEPLPSSVVSVIAVQITGAYKKGDGGAHVLTQRCRSGTTDAPGVGFLAPYPLQSTYTFYSDLFMVDPATSAAWTLAAVNAMQIGYRLES